MISMFTMIAVGTKNLKTGRPVIRFQPLVELRSMMKEVVGFSKRASVIVDVVDVQKKWFGFSAASASISPISHYRLVLKAVIVGKGDFAALLRVVFGPLHGTFRVLRRVFLAIITDPIDRPQFPFFAVLHKALVTLPSVPFLLILRLVASGTGFNHGFASVVKSIFDYDYNVKGKVQRPERNLVGSSDPKRIAARTAGDMVCSAWRHAAAF